MAARRKQNKNGSCFNPAVTDEQCGWERDGEPLGGKQPVSSFGSDLCLWAHA
jgi:hypothetical protein